MIATTTPPLPTVQVATTTLQLASSTPLTLPLLPLSTTTLDTATPPVDNSGFLPFVANVTASSTATSTIVSWTTSNQVSSTLVTFGTSTAYTATSTGNDVSLQHLVTLQNLLPGTTYHYSVSSSNGFGTVVSPDATFTTPGFAGVGDTMPPGIAMLIVTPPANTLDSTALVSWTTDQPTMAWVMYGATSNYTSVAKANADLEIEPNEDHIFLLSGLLPGMTYHYKVVSQNAAGAWRATADQTFNTAAL